MKPNKKRYLVGRSLGAGEAHCLLKDLVSNSGRECCRIMSTSIFFGLKEMSNYTGSWVKCEFKAMSVEMGMNGLGESGQTIPFFLKNNR